MAQIKKKWRIISLVYLLLSYIVIVVVLEKPLSLYLLNVGIFILLLILVFLGTFCGFLGLIIHMISKNEKAAAPLYNLAYKFGTGNPTIMASYGLILLRQNQAKKALECFQNGFNASTNYMTTKTLMSNIAISLWKLDQTQEAIEQYHKIIKRFGSDEQIFLTEPDYSDDNVEQFTSDNHIMYPQDYITLGFLYILQEDYEKATFFTKAAMFKKENYASAYDNLGQIAFYQKDYEEAALQFDKALEFDPRLPDSLYFMGRVQAINGDAKKALTFYEKAKACNLDGLNTISYEMIDEAISTL